MKEIKEQFSAMIAALGQNELIVLSASKILPGYPPEELKELEDGLGISLHDPLRDFYLQMGGCSLVWSLDADRARALLPDEDDLESIGGAIQILNPFDMIMGKDGLKWKNVLWFDQMDEQQKNVHQAFAPFDFPTPELIAGFQMQGTLVSANMLLYDSSTGIRNFSLSLEEYVAELLRTRGYHYWQEFLTEDDSEERERFDRIMPVLSKG
jgi:hypothetical protein